MRLASYRLIGETRVGALDDGALIDLARAYTHLLRADGEIEAAAIAAAELPGDVVSIAITGLGMLENPVVAEES
jgi:hypothetical protein